jgi:hypothetical protein
LYFGMYGAVMKVTPAQAVETFAGKEAGLGRVDQIKIDAKDNVYVNDLGVIRKITQRGAVSTVLANGCKPSDWMQAAAAGCTAGLVDGKLEGQMVFISGFEVDADGNIYYIDANANALRKVTPSGVLSTIVRGEFPARP